MDIASSLVADGEFASVGKPTEGTLNDVSGSA
jgi:hypothetical protein